MEKHPELKKVEPVWKRIKILMDEDVSKYTEPEFMLPLPNERLTARKERELAFVTGFVNTTQAVVRAKGDTVYAKEITRANLSPSQQAFLERADKSKQPLQEIMQNEVAPTLAAYGTVFAVMDKPKTVAATKEQEIKSGLPYLTVLDPEQLLDFAWAEDGELLWVMYSVTSPVDRTNPTKPVKAWSSDKGIAIWTRFEYMVVSSDLQTNLTKPIPNPFGFVPVIIQAQFVDPNKTIGKSTFFTGSNYLIMANNLNAASNGEVFKNASSTLLMNIMDYGDDAGDAKIEHEKSPDSNLSRIKKQADDIPNIILYQNPADRPEYLARDLDLIEYAQTRADKYFELVTENEKATMSPDTLQNPASGVSKGYDFMAVNKMLVSFGNALNYFENQAFEMVALMSGETNQASIAYPTDYDVRGFNARLEFIKGLIDASYPSKTGMNESYKSLTPEITKSTELRVQIDKEIDESETVVKPEPVVVPPNNQGF